MPTSQIKVSGIAIKPNGRTPLIGLVMKDDFHAEIDRDRRGGQLPEKFRQRLKRSHIVQQADHQDDRAAQQDAEYRMGVDLDPVLRAQESRPKRTATEKPIKMAMPPVRGVLMGMDFSFVRFIDRADFGGKTANHWGNKMVKMSAIRKVSRNITITGLYYNTTRLKVTTLARKKYFLYNLFRRA